MENISNHILLRGSLKALPELSHENHGKTFFRFFLEVPRLSGTIDTLPIIMEQSLLNTLDLSAGENITIEGQIRSHNIRKDGIRHLMIFVFAQSVLAEDGAPLNEVSLEGCLCREPTYRRTPLGREICDIMLAVTRSFHRADYLPCILWGSTAKQVSWGHTKDVVQVYGRLQSRIYTKLTPAGSEERTAYEISALTADLLSQEEEGVNDDT